MKNYIQPGAIVGIIAPAGGATTGQPLLINALFGIATLNGDAGEPIELLTCGVVDLNKGIGAIALGAKAYWKADDQTVVAAVTGNTLIGVALKDAASGDDTVQVRLNGSFG